MQVLRTHLLLDAVGAETLDRAAYEELGLVEAVTQGIARIAEHDEVARLAHESRHMADISVDDDIDAFHRDAAARRRIALYDEQAAAPGSARILAGIAFDHDFAGHHVFRDARSCRAVNRDRSAIVHAGAIVADGAVHIDHDGTVDPDGDRMAATRIGDFVGQIVRALLNIMQGPIEFTQRRGGKINNRHT